MNFNLLVEEVLNELFSSSIKADWSPVKNSFVTSFTTGPAGPEDNPTKKYILTVTKGEGIYNELYQDLDDEDLDYVDLKKDREFNKFVNANKDLPVYNITFEDVDYSPMRDDKGKSSFGITGEGNAVEVFSKVVGLLRDFLSTNEIRVVGFTASEPSRIKLYNTMVRKLASELGYNSFQYNNINRTAHYILYK